MANLSVRKQGDSEMLRLKHDFESLFDRIFRHHGDASQPEDALAFLSVLPPIESWIDSNAKEFHLSMPLPGVNPEGVNIVLRGNQLTFSGEQNDEKDKSEKNYLAREFSYDRFVRTVTLPKGVEGGKLTAELKDGVLEMRAPMDAAELPKRIPVSNGASTKGGAG